MMNIFRTLLVEDDPDQLLVFKDKLSQRDHEVTAVLSAEEAWEACQCQSFDLAVLDAVLPGMDGLDLCRKIRSLPQGDRTVIIVVTGNRQPDTIKTAISAGVDDFLVKPIAPGLFEVRMAFAELRLQDRIEKQLIEKDRRAGQARYRTLFDSISDAVFVHEVFEDGSLGQFIEVNQEACRRLGYSREELLKMSPMDIDVSDPRAASTIIEELMTQDASTFERIFVGKDGQRFPVEVSGRIFEFEEQKTNISVVRDLTYSRRVEKELRQAKDDAEAANVAKSQFLANMSHEIRTPLHGIVGMVQMALEEDLTRELRQYLQIVFTSAETLSALIGDILDFSKIDAGKLELESNVFELADCVCASLLSVTVQAQEKGVELNWDVQPDVPALVRGDELRLRQVLVNLVGNAVKFTEQGSVSVDLELESADGDEVVVHFAVSDTGIGVPVENIESVFETFTQVDGSYARSIEGTGLGLSICKNLVEMMGGRIWVESQHGRGSTFYFTARLQAVSTRDVQGPWAPLQGLSVLVVSEGKYGSLLCEQLARRGMNSILANDVAAAQHQQRKAKERGAPFAVALIESNLAHGVWFDTLRETTKVIPLSPTDTENGFNPKELAHVIVGAIERAQPDSGITTGQAPLQIGSVLVVDDNKVNRTMTQLFLEKLECPCDVVSSGEETLRILQASAYDVVLLDVQMPVMDGIETAQRIRQDLPENQQPWIIALTAAAAPEDRERCLAAGMDDYLSKPVQIGQLRSRLQECPQRILSHDRIEPVAQHPADDRIDVSCLDEVRQIDPNGEADLLRNVVSAFRKNSSQQLKAMKNACGAVDSEGLAHAAHNLKGSSRQLGAIALGEMCSELEEAAKQRDLSAAEQHVEAIDSEVERTVTVFESYCSKFRLPKSQDQGPP